MSEGQISIECRHCGKTINVKEKYQGKESQCPACGGKIVIPAAEDVSEETAPDLSGKKVLLVDDDNAFLVLMAALLKPTNCLIVTARDGVQATMVARKENPDLIFLDIGLPGGDGFVLLERWEGSIQVNASIIVTTSKHPQAYRERSLNAGAKAFLSKVDIREKLFETIREVMPL